jgi:hypothetical protein
MLYDAATGLPVSGQSESSPVNTFSTKKTHPSHEMHQHVQKSQTLNRHVVRNDAPVKTAVRPSVQRSPLVSKFASHPVKTNSQSRLVSDIGPSIHPIVKKAEARIDIAPRRASPATRPAAVIKQEAVSEALNKAPSHMSARPVKTSRRRPRALSLVSATLALLLLGGYFTYINLPNLSVRVAAAQAGINAEYPAYRPDGYRLAGVTYSKGSVSIKFAANAGPQDFTLTQQQTAWDSTAVKENYVEPNWGNDAIPYAEHGLTIYTHDGNAVWVNGGILYTISGDAPLSSSQVRAVATNL